ncbi:hypothetical protein SSCG_05742 [Streptomyces clavuligerus]|nr:hypothetical protein SSCG_05742 [Streptomyces clavuligerus]
MEVCEPTGDLPGHYDRIISTIPATWLTAMGEQRRAGVAGESPFGARQHLWSWPPPELRERG